MSAARFEGPKVGDTIAVPTSQRWCRQAPVRRTIARVMPTRIEDNAGAVWRRDNGRRVGGDGWARPWTDADTAEEILCAKFDELRRASDALGVALSNGVSLKNMQHAQPVIDAITAMLGGAK